MVQSGKIQPPDPAVPAGHDIGYFDFVKRCIQKSAKNPVAFEGTLGVGSSILKEWNDLHTDLKEFKAVNHGFGGARTWELLAYAEPLVVQFRPKVILLYCGSNDIRFGEQPDGIVARIKTFVDYVETALPGVHLIYISIHRAPEKEDRWEWVSRTNAMVKALTE